MSIDSLPHKPKRRGSIEVVSALPATQHTEAVVPSGKLAQKQHSLLKYLDDKYGCDTPEAVEDRWSSGEDMKTSSRLSRSKSSNGKAAHYLSVLAKDLIQDTNRKGNVGRSSQRNSAEIRQSASRGCRTSNIRPKKSSSLDSFEKLRRRHSSDVSLCSLPTIQEFQRAVDHGMENEQIKCSVRSLPSSRTLNKMRVPRGRKMSIPSKKLQVAKGEASNASPLLVWDRFTLESCMERLSMVDAVPAKSHRSASPHLPPKPPIRIISPEVTLCAGRKKAQGAPLKRRSRDR
jgi:hypothetical protein